MSDYILEVKSWVTHFWGTVKGEYPTPCHGGSHYNAPESHGMHTCDLGHELPARIRWEVEAPWTEERYMRYAAKHFDSPGPCQFMTEQEVIDAAAGRFTGAFPCQWWEEKVIPGEPGDKLWAGWIPHRLIDQEMVEKNWGTLIAVVPAAKGEESDDAQDTGRPRLEHSAGQSAAAG